ncbi:MAG TPA: gluconate 2-dehydrogenase subunit 3 family protein, partial [Thermomicrobiales bacterium]|nr:gluconate 2-dehydrogenase subunit 3 family protein [Thermomicrobiales bacterium]
NDRQHGFPLRLDRRTFVRGGSATVAMAAMSGSVIVYGQLDPEDPVVQGGEAGPFATVMDPPEQAPSAGNLQALTPHEAETVDAITSRILPGSPDDPGAHEAGVVVYIDTLLAFNQGYASFTYLQGPWAQTTTSAPAASATPMASPGAAPVASPGSSPSPSASPATDFDVIMVDPDEIERYGYQSRLSPRDVYRIGIAALDRYARQRYEQLFKDLDPKDQDTIVDEMARGTIENFDPALTAQSFFQNLRQHTAEGMFSDPAYGGNRDMVGWKLVGFPGAQRAYIPIEFQTEGTDRQPQSLAELHHFNPGENRNDNDNVILPVSGSEEEEHDHDSKP